MSFKLNVPNDYYEEKDDIFPKRSVVFDPGLTVLIGCNGSGKTTLLRILKNYLKGKMIPYVSFDNLKEGGSWARSRALFKGDIDMFARSWYSSEGEDIALNIGNICGRFAAACSEHEEGDIFLLLDSADSGLSIDNVIDLKDVLQDIIRTMSNDKRNVYIIISANEYELAAGENCLNVSKLRYVRIRTYGRYKQVIMESRAQKGRLYQEKSGAEPCPSGE